MKIFLFVLFCFAFFMPKNSFAYDEPNYDTLNKEGKIEVRKYQDSIVAEAIMGADRNDGSNGAFRGLFKYIGANDIPMTIPVRQEKIAGNWNMAFYMPDKFTLENTPKPSDSKVRIKKIKGEKVVVIKFSGRWTDKNFKKHEATLRNYLIEKKISFMDNPIYAYYNSPVRPWFLRRNEVMFKIY